MPQKSIDDIHKKVFLTLSKDVIRRNIYDTDFWEYYNKELVGYKKVLIVPKDRVNASRELFGGEDVEIVGYQKKQWRGWSKFVFFFVRVAMHSHSTRLYRMRAHKRGDAGIFSTFSKEVIAATLGRSSSFKQLMRLLVSRLKVDSEIEMLFDVYQPVHAFVPSLMDLEFDVPFASAAKRRGIFVSGMVRSWDNLNNHGLMPVAPNNFIVQNKWLIEAARKFQGFKEYEKPKIVVGLPHYDRYKNIASKLYDKDEFFSKIGLDINKKTVYLTGFDFYYSEDTLVKLIDEIAAELGNVQVLFTRHPKSIFSVEDYGFESLSNVVYYDLFKSQEIGFHNTEDLFINFIAHADVVINMASTVSVDCAVLDKPCVCVSFDHKHDELSYWEQAARLHDSFDHFEKLVATGGVALVHNSTELKKQIRIYLEHPKTDKEKRADARDLLVSPFDGRAGERLARLVVEDVRKLG